MQLYKIIIPIILLLNCQACSMLDRSKTIVDCTRRLSEAAIAERYDECMGMMYLDTASDSAKAMIRMQLPQFRKTLVENFGTKLSFHLVGTEKVWSADPGKSTAPGTTRASVEFRSDSNIGMFLLSFDDRSGKILRIDFASVKEPIPNMTVFWLFGILPLSVLLFNIWVLLQIRRSSLSKKWLRYLGIILLNVPTFTYTAVGGLSIKYFHALIFGCGFGVGAILSSYWSFCLPLGAFYQLWRLRRKQDLDAHDQIIGESYLPNEGSGKTDLIFPEEGG